MPTLSDMYAPEHLSAARDLCEWIHDEATPATPATVRRGSQVPCRACLSETEPSPSLERLILTLVPTDPWGA